VRNTLQINQGPGLKQNDSLGPPVFSDVAFLSGIAETDWSWAPVVTDFDNDGNRDIIITNGFPKDVTDHDFIVFRNKANMLATRKEILEQIPQVKIANYAYKNNGNLSFTNVTEDWGMSLPSFSSGAAYADLDNDGALDLIINNINDKASVYRNNAGEIKKENRHYLQVQLLGDSLNRNGIGAWIELHYSNGKQQVYENTPYRGYLSSSPSDVHFGLGTTSLVDSVVVKWPNGKMQLIQQVKANQELKVNIRDATINSADKSESIATSTLFRELTDSLNIHFLQHDSDFVDFNIQKLLPHKFSEYGPALAAGDIDGNGLEDIVAGGSFFYEAQVFLQQQEGRFIQRNLTENKAGSKKDAEDLGLLLWDADGDKDLDLYIASGGYEAQPNSSSYQDRLYVNDGKGNFSLDTTVLPKNFTSKFCVRAADYDKDGDLDLFVAGRVDPWNYPKPVSSFIFRNDTKNGKILFTDVTNDVAKELINIGLICDALFTDFDNDGWQDLVLAGEWMPVTFLKNTGGRFASLAANSGISKQVGWWNTIAPGDFDNDGDIDYIAGNLGKNSFYRASENFPVCITAKDFDNNGSYDALPSLFLPSKFGDTTRKEYPAQVRDDMVKQIISMRSKFQNYKSYATATMNEVLTEEQRKGAIRLQANFLQSAFLRNEGNGRFSLTALPIECQFSVLNGMAVEDFDGDGNLDVVINGNDYGTEVAVGRYDALNGLFLKGNGEGGFSPLPILKSGIFIPGNGKALVKLRSRNGRCLLAAAENKGPLKIFELKKDVSSLPLAPSDVYAIIKFKNGKQQKREFYYGDSFLSQSARFLLTGSNIASVDVVDGEGRKRMR